MPGPAKIGFHGIKLQSDGAKIQTPVGTGSGASRRFSLDGHVLALQELSELPCMLVQVVYAVQDNVLDEDHVFRLQ